MHILRTVIINQLYAGGSWVIIILYRYAKGGLAGPIEVVLARPVDVSLAGPVDVTRYLNDME
jgi:hypothetical protein